MRTILGLVVIASAALLAGCDDAEKNEQAYWKESEIAWERYFFGSLDDAEHALKEIKLLLSRVSEEKHPLAPYAAQWMVWYSRSYDLNRERGAIDEALIALEGAIKLARDLRPELVDRVEGEPSDDVGNRLVAAVNGGLVPEWKLTANDHQIEDSGHGEEDQAERIREIRERLRRQREKYGS